MVAALPHLAMKLADMGHPAIVADCELRRNAGVSPLRFAPVEMTCLVVGVAEAGGCDGAIGTGCYVGAGELE